MAFMMKLPKSMEITMFGIILIKFLITYLLLQSLKEAYFAYMVDYHPESQQ